MKPPGWVIKHFPVYVLFHEKRNPCGSTGRLLHLFFTSTISLPLSPIFFIRLYPRISVDQIFILIDVTPAPELGDQLSDLERICDGVELVQPKTPERPMSCQEVGRMQVPNLTQTLLNRSSEFTRCMTRSKAEQKSKGKRVCSCSNMLVTYRFRRRNSY